MTVIPGRQEHYISGLTDRDGALLLSNIDTNGIHETPPTIEFATDRTGLLIAYSIYWVFHTNTWFNLRKTNAANEEPVG